MEKYFGNAYRGDPGVPHADADRFVNIWIGSAAFSVLTWVNPYMWQLSNQFKYYTLSCIIEFEFWGFWCFVFGFSYVSDIALDSLFGFTVKVLLLMLH